MRNIYVRNTLRGAQGKYFACPPLNIPLYITLIMILYENMKPTEHILHCLKCVLSHVMCARGDRIVGFYYPILSCF